MARLNERRFGAMRGDSSSHSWRSEIELQFALLQSARLFPARGAAGEQVVFLGEICAFLFGATARSGGRVEDIQGKLLLENNVLDLLGLPGRVSSFGFDPNPKAGKLGAFEKDMDGRSGSSFFRVSTTPVDPEEARLVRVLCSNPFLRTYFDVLDRGGSKGDAWC